MPTLRPNAIAARTVLAFLAAALASSAAFASPPSSGGPFIGTIGQGHSTTHNYSTHPPGTMCLDIYIPHTYLVRIENAPPTDTLGLSAHGQSTLTRNGVGGVSFIANYCTAFPITVTGVSVASKATYAVTVSHVNALPDIVSAD